MKSRLGFLAPLIGHPERLAELPVVEVARAAGALAEVQAELAEPDGQTASVPRPGASPSLLSPGTSTDLVEKLSR